ncbi:hypothetical protein EHS13_03270 [Paenibacillus psychroresistens]|uniref:Chemotaxis protein CheX n=1 Tax=Paenibacillus psychroresistens TaxID=1778678 RepID=A0A6B8RF60_9BACL|nr:hypothetical protein [Paenibacillus psychroresistens]QGQ93996.1 hypothetical protein EHS13_03270 [Paenibacillus psychroresistens]
MFAQYFGQFLFNHALVTGAELESAMIAQKETRVKLGVLAINHSHMTSDQVETVQIAQMRVDKKFGEIAVELGFLTEELVNTLLSSQKSAHLILGQTLIDQGVLSYEAFAEALNKYKQEYSLSDEQFNLIVNGNIETLLEAVLSKGGFTEQDALSDYISLFAKSLIRFVDSNIRLELISIEEKVAYDWVAQQAILSGDHSGSRITAIGGSEAAFLQLASMYAQESIEEPDEMMKASVGEFLNLHNGIYLVNRSNDGVELDMLPQTVTQQDELVANTPITAVIRIIGAYFTCDLLISDLRELA